MRTFMRSASRSWQPHNAKHTRCQARPCAWTASSSAATDYQLFAVYTVEKRIGICLKGCGWWRFNVFNLCSHENVGGGCQNERRKGNGKGCRERKDGVIVVTSSGYIDFSFEYSRVVRPASCMMGSPMHEGQPRGIRRRESASCPACHFPGDMILRKYLMIHISK